MKVTHGGTQMYCRFCKAVTVCRAVPSTRLGQNPGQRWYNIKYSDVQWFRRCRECQTCENLFLTAEVAEVFLDELIELRESLAELKRNAEEFSKQSKAAGYALQTLNRSLEKLRALDVEDTLK